MHACQAQLGDHMLGVLPSTEEPLKPAHARFGSAKGALPRHTRTVWHLRAAVHARGSVVSAAQASSTVDDDADEDIDTWTCSACALAMASAKLVQLTAGLRALAVATQRGLAAACV